MAGSRLTPSLSPSFPRRRESRTPFTKGTGSELSCFCESRCGFQLGACPLCERRIALGRRYGDRHRDARVLPDEKELSHGASPRIDSANEISGLEAVVMYFNKMTVKTNLFLTVLLPIILGSLLLRSAVAVEHVVAKQGGRLIRVSGEVQVEAADGGIMLHSSDGSLWVMQPEEIIERRHDEEIFQLDNAETLKQGVPQQLPQGFRVHETRHYLIFYSTSEIYAQWCGTLYEGLYKAFYKHWKNRGLELTEPDQPLVVIIFADRQRYRRFSQEELKDGATTIVGYYSLQSNRVTTYDLTGVETLRQQGDRRGSRTEINKILARPAAAQMVATIVHEAVHQLAFNSGMQSRFADIPLWVSEGLAVYFETPNLSRRKINYYRLRRFKTYAKNRPFNSLTSLVVNDQRFRNPNQLLDAYAEAWALNYYLLRGKSKEYVKYLKLLSDKPPLVEDGPKARLEQFEQAFGDIKKLDLDFLRRTGRLKLPRPK